VFLVLLSTAVPYQSAADATSALAAHYTACLSTEAPEVSCWFVGEGRALSFSPIGFEVAAARFSRAYCSAGAAAAHQPEGREESDQKVARSLIDGTRAEQQEEPEGGRRPPQALLFRPVYGSLGCAQWLRARAMPWTSRRNRSPAAPALRRWRPGAPAGC
jgi:hypothetical protein